MLQNRTIDKNTPVPLYYQLKTLILEEIKNGEYVQGTMIPTELEISEMFDISRTTVRQAITELVQEGYLYRVKSKGTFVSKPKVEFHLLSSIYDSEVEASGRKAHMVVLERKVVDMPQVLLDLRAGKAGEKAIYLDRVRIADGVPINRSVSYLPYEAFKEIMDMDFNETSIHDFLKQKPETTIYRIKRTCEAMVANKELAKILDLDVGAPVQLITSVRYNSKEEVIDISYAYYRADMNSISFELISPQ